MHFYESMVVTTADGMTFKTYANEHPSGFIVAKPKYIPADRISCDEFQHRELDGVPVCRFNYWVKPAKLQSYLDGFKQHYSGYIYDCPYHNTWFFGVPVGRVDHAPDPRRGVKALLSRDDSELDRYLWLTRELLFLMEKSGVSLRDLGTTNSTLLGNYTHGRSDIDILVFGKQNYWDVINYMKTATHPLLKWRDYAGWKKYYDSYNEGLNFTEQEFIKQAMRKRSDGLFEGNVFSLFGVSEPGEGLVKWGDEQHERLGLVTVRGKVINNFDAAVRPGYYEIEGKVVENGLRVNRIVTWARDFMLQAFPGEEVVARGMLERITTKGRESFYQVAVGYFDSYLDRKGEEYIKVKFD